MLTTIQKYLLHCFNPHIDWLLSLTYQHLLKLSMSLLMILWESHIRPRLSLITPQRTHRSLSYDSQHQALLMSDSKSNGLYQMMTVFITEWSDRIYFLCYYISAKNVGVVPLKQDQFSLYFTPSVSFRSRLSNVILLFLIMLRLHKIFLVIKVLPSRQENASDSLFWRLKT